jgi:hypothetical protein
VQFEGQTKTLKKQGKSHQDCPEARVFPNLVKIENDYSRNLRQIGGNNCPMDQAEDFVVLSKQCSLVVV